MISSPLVGPLVAPLVGRGAPGRGRSALQRSRLATSALAVSALIAVTTNVDAGQLLDKAQPKAPAPARAARVSPAPVVQRSAHQKPRKTTTSVVTAFLVFRVGRDELLPPGEAPDFENAALEAARSRHGLDRTREPGPGLGLGRRLDRLFGSIDSTYLHFGSGQHQSAVPAR